MTTPLVTIIIPTHNSEAFVDECLKSAVQQSYSNIEIFIIDDGSCDNTLKICRTFCDLYANKIKIFSIPSCSVGHARNFGWNKSNGKYVAFLDSDDVWHKDKLKHQIKIMEEYNLDLFSSDFTNNINKLNDIIPDLRVHKCTLSKQLYKTRCHLGATVVRKNVDERFADKNYAEDQYLMFSILANKKFKCMYDSSSVLFYRTSRALNEGSSLSDNQDLLYREGIKKNLQSLLKLKKINHLQYSFYSIHCWLKYRIRKLFDKTIFYKSK